MKFEFPLKIELESVNCILKFVTFRGGPIQSQGPFDLTALLKILRLLYRFLTRAISVGANTIAELTITIP